MARLKLTHGLFKLSPKVGGKYPPIGDAVEKFTDNKTGQTRLGEFRQLEITEGRDPYLYVLLPLGPKGEGLLPLGV